jgi:hypothetical protein
MLRLFPLLSTAAVALCLAGCSRGPTEPTTETILFLIQGTVSSMVDGSPVQGAIVVLGWGGSFSPPSELARVSTDEQGGYGIEHPVVVRSGSCPSLWTGAFAEGFETRGGPWSTLFRPGCGGGIQRLDIALKPL